MSHFRFVPLAVALVAASTLIACTTSASMPMGSSPSTGMATPERTAAMDGQMKTMRDMHTKMMNAKTPEERQALMGEHMKAMQGGMGMMKGMSGMSGMNDSKGMSGMSGMSGMNDSKGMSGMSGMSGMNDSKGMPADMTQRHTNMAQHMAMMQMMMDMMSQRMPADAGRQ